MRFRIIAVGKLRPHQPEAQLYQEYAKRLPWALECKEIEVKHYKNLDLLKEKEADHILANLPSQCWVVALDERGKSFTSPQFANHLTEWSAHFTSPVHFIIGGAGGLSARIRERANITLSFGTMVWPHALVRVMLIEQLYRSYSLLNQHPYHRE